MLGFGFNKTKVLASAERHLQQGRLQQAIGEYQKVLKHDARDLTVLNTVGDLYARCNQVAEATACFREVAEAYAQSGFMVKAIALYKKLSKLNPGNVEYGLKLGELYRNQGLHSDARAQYLQAAETLLRAGKVGGRNAALRKDSGSRSGEYHRPVPARRIVCAFREEKQATELLFRLMETALRRHSPDAADQALGRIMALVRKTQAGRISGRLALERGNPATAAKFLEAFPRCNPANPACRAWSRCTFRPDRSPRRFPLPSGC